MLELLAALRSLILAAGAVAPSVSQDAAGTDTPLQRSQARLAEIEALAQSEAPSTTWTARMGLIGDADALCDAADAAAKDKDSASAVFGVRWKLASHAFKLGAWTAAAALYADIVAYEVREWGPSHPDTLEGKRCLAECLTKSQEAKPWPQREYKQPLQLFGEVADAWSSRLEAALEAPGSGPLAELRAAAYARRDLGIAYLATGARTEARTELNRAFQILREHIDRLDDVDLLQQLCADHQEAGDDRAWTEINEVAARLVESHFPGRRDLVLGIRVDRIVQFAAQGLELQAAELARTISAEAAELERVQPEVLAHLLRVAGNALTQVGMPGDAQPLLRKALVLVGGRDTDSARAEARVDSKGLADALIGLGQYAEAIRILETADLDPVSFHMLRADARSLDGFPELALTDLEEALKAIELRSGSFPPASVDPDRMTRLFCKIGIATIHASAGRTAQALAALERPLQEYRQRPRTETGFELNALRVTAEIRYAAGDVTGAYALNNEALEAWKSRVHPDENRVQVFRIQLGACAFLLGRFSEAEQLSRAARDAYLRRGWPGLANFPAIGLAGALAALGRWDEAQPLAVECLEYARASGSSNPWSVAEPEAILGAIALGKGDPSKAAGLLRDGVSGMSRSRSAIIDPGTISYYRGKLISALAAMSDARALTSELAKLRLDTKDRLERISVLSARERGEIAANLLRLAEQATASCRTRPDAMEPRALFEWLANLRAAGGPAEFAVQHGSGIEGSKRLELTKLRDEAMRARHRVAAMSFGPQRGAGEVGNALFEQASAARDTAERNLYEQLPAGSRFAWLEAGDLAVRLEARAALAISIHRIRASLPGQKEDRFLAFTLDGKAHLRRIDLGPAAAIEDKVRAWREAAVPGRGRPVPSGKPDLRALGAELRAAVLDRVLEGATERRVFLCLDDALHTIPWDALPAGPRPEAAKSGDRPAEAGRLVGDDYRIAELPSLRELHDAVRRPRARNSLLALGDIDYAAPGAAGKGVPLADRPMRGSAETFAHFDRLLFSNQEVEGLARTFEETQKRTPQVLRGEKATKEALFRLAKDATHLHISTHGYFASEGTDSTGSPGQATWRGAVTGFAPLSLCGLALAGANRDVGALEEVVGIATAEELAGLDLSACELAVLSGCETNLGVRRAGQDLASLKSALHAAGARNVVASLWGVPDEQTSQLMRRFYEYLWTENLPPDEALWKAKNSLRELPLQAWAGWVFSGVPQTK